MSQYINKDFFRRVVNDIQKKIDNIANELSAKETMPNEAAKERYTISITTKDKLTLPTPEVAEEDGVTYCAPYAILLQVTDDTVPKWFKSIVWPEDTAPALEVGKWYYINLDYRINKFYCTDLKMYNS